MNNNIWQELGFNNTQFYRKNEAETIIQQVIDNLGHALNARAHYVSNESLYKSKLLSYGLPDLSNFNPGIDGQYLKLCNTLKNYIQQHEPRLHQIEVELQASEKQNPIKLHFNIFAVLNVNDIDYAIKLNSVFKLDKLKFFIEKELS